MEIKQTVPFSFAELYKDIETKFADKGYDALYEGSNTAQLITAMTYLTSMLNVNTAVNVNETILTLANKRNNVLTDARILGYEIEHTTSYIYKLKLEFAVNGTYIIPKYSEFKSGTKTYYYMDNDISVTVNGTPEIVYIHVKEGNLKTFANEPKLLSTTIGYIIEAGQEVIQYYVDVPFEKVEENGLEVFLTYYDEFGVLHENEPWSKSNKFMIDKDSKIDKEYIRLDDIDFKMPRLYFKLANVGKGLRHGTIVKINALISSGDKGLLSDIPTTTIPNVNILDYFVITQGAEEESLSSIKETAPLFHNSANRAVTKSDYKAICTRQTAIKEAEIWGGEDEYPKAPGHIWFSFTPETITKEYKTTDEFNNEFLLMNPSNQVNWFVEPEEIQSNTYDASGKLLNPGVWDVLENYKIPTLIYHHRNPIYIDFEYEINIMKYHIQTSKADIHKSVFEIIRDYFDISTNVNVDTYNERLLNMEAFERDYFHSNLEKRIDINLTDITGFNNNLKTKIMITSGNIVYENTDGVFNHAAIIPLGVPYETYFKNGNLLVDVLPSIDTNKFLNFEDVKTDWSQLTGGEEFKELIKAPIMLGFDVIGEYILHNNSKKYIEIKLYIGDADGTGIQSNSILKKTDFDTTRYLNLKYFSPNFTIIKNSIARLSNVKFVDVQSNILA